MAHSNTCVDNLKCNICRTQGQLNYLFIQCYAAKNRIPTLHLSEEQPTGNDIRSIPFKQYIPGYEEQANLKADMKVMVERICVAQLSYFNDLTEHIVWNFEHQHSKELSTEYCAKFS